MSSKAYLYTPANTYILYMPNYVNSVAHFVWHFIRKKNTSIRYTMLTKIIIIWLMCLQYVSPFILIVEYFRLHNFRHPFSTHMHTRTYAPAFVFHLLLFYFITAILGAAYRCRHLDLLHKPVNNILPFRPIYLHTHTHTNNAKRKKQRKKNMSTFASRWKSYHITKFYINYV